MATGIVHAGFAQADKTDLQDFVDERLTKASALLHQTYGEGGEAFRLKRDEDQDNCLWAISGLLDEAIAARQELASRAAPAVGQIVDGEEAEAVQLFRGMTRPQRDAFVQAAPVRAECAAVLPFPQQPTIDKLFAEAWPPRESMKIAGAIHLQHMLRTLGEAETRRFLRAVIDNRGE